MAVGEFYAGGSAPFEVIEISDTVPEEGMPSALGTASDIFVETPGSVDAVDVIVNGAADAVEPVVETVALTFSYRDGLADDVAAAADQLAGAISGEPVQWAYVLQVVAASVGAAAVGIWVGDRIIPGGRTTVGKAFGAVLGTVAFDVLSRRLQK